MVTTVNDIPKGKCVIVEYSDGQYVVIWNYEEFKQTEFYSPYIKKESITTARRGSFRFKNECKYIRDATSDEIEQLQNYLNREGIRYIIQAETNYELW